MIEPGDLPGLPQERTDLAWERTAVSVAAVAGLVLFHQVTTVGAALAIAAATLALVILGVARRRRHRITPATVAIPLTGWGIGALASGLLVLVAVS